MDASAALSLGHALHTVHARFVFHAGKNAIPRNPRDDLFDAAQFGFLVFEDFQLPAFVLAIALIHPQEIPREKRGLIATRAWANFEDRRPRIRRILGQKGKAYVLFRRL